MSIFQSGFVRFAAALVATTLSAVCVHAEILNIQGAAGNTIPVYWEKVEGATATVILLSGGDGEVRFRGSESKPRGNNFLIRSYDLFLNHKVNVALMGTNIPLTFEERAKDSHLADLATIANTARGLSPVPVWLVGTSRGTVSAALAAIKYSDKKVFDGVVLTSALVSWKKPYAIGRQNIEKITMPVLVYMHEDDACEWCQFHEAKGLIGKFKNAPVQAFMGVRGGTPEGNPCHASHNHGFMGMEEKAVSDVVGWATWVVVVRAC